ncbi:hypothetical protein FD723_39690 (plasmid) [Nostoc sp. C052]|uniref:hypothetical protein n=1 Tax=Nostoc sp. C052 TaxID=2576902 RepID=UPI0015C3625C|nr:hypothetical protein [Nostoc sp. C052]QLE46335.1 hypothetical protein FD723_39690 [Nostoc sp. C052]
MRRIFLKQSSNNDLSFEYWRIINLTPAGGNSQGMQWICRELRFLDADGEIISVGGTPQAYSFPGTNASPAFDGNTNSFVSITSQTPPTTGLGIGYHFSRAVLPYSIEISNLNNGFNIPPSEYCLQKSSDNSSWITHQLFSISTADTEFQSVEVVGAAGVDPNDPKHRYWRIINTNAATGGNSQWICRELRFLDSDGETISLGGTPQLYSWTEDNPAKVFDYNWNTFTTITSPIQSDKLTGMGIGYKFTKNVLPYYVEVINLNNGANIPPTEFLLQKSRDNVTWTNHQAFTLTTNEADWQAVQVVGAIKILHDPITLLYLRGNGENESTSIIDSSTYNLTPLKIGNPIISTANSKFEGASIYLDGNSALNYESALFNVGRKACTIEMFFNPDITPGNVILEMRPDNTNGNYIQASFNGTTFGMYYNAVNVIAAPVTISPGSWYYLGIKKYENKTELWFEGSKLGEFTSGGWGASGRIKIGQNAYYAPGTNFKGYIDQFIFTLNLAKDLSIIPNAPFS